MKHSTWHRHSSRILALVMVVALLAAQPAAAAGEIGNGVTPTYDEAYYAMLDYYGNLTQGSIVKSYTLNGADQILDYGVYDSVNNLTDGTAPTITDGRVCFDFDGGAPDHFYFEGSTDQPFQDLPWTISMSYRLNGVPTRAEGLAGQTGVVEIDLNFVPNEQASDYAKHNYTLEAMALFNQDDILSLKAEGAQVQLIGNLRMVLFLCLPGEEQHFTIEVGSSDFSFGGMTFLMVPATLAQLEQIAEISQKKDELEDDYHKLSGSFDELLSAMNSMTGSLNAAASGLDMLNQARGTFSAGKGVLYDGTDLLKSDLESLAAQLDPVAEQVQALSQTVTESKATLNSMVDTTVSLQTQLKNMENALENLEDGTGDLQDLLDSAADMKSSLNSLKRALNNVSGVGSSDDDSTDSSTSSRELVKKVKAVHNAYDTGNLESFMAQMLVINGSASSSAQAGAMAGQLSTLTGVPAEMVGQLTAEQQEYWKSAQQLKALHDYAQASSFQKFCEQLPGVSASEAKQMNDLWIVYDSGKLETSSPSGDAADPAGPAAPPDETPGDGASGGNTPEEDGSAGGSDSEPQPGEGENQGADSSSSGDSQPDQTQPDGSASSETGKTKAMLHAPMVRIALGLGDSSSDNEPSSGSNSNDNSDDDSNDNSDDGNNDNSDDNSNDDNNDNSNDDSNDDNNDNSNDDNNDDNNDDSNDNSDGDNNGNDLSGDNNNSGNSGSSGEGGQGGTGSGSGANESGTVGGAAVDLITGGLDSAMSSISSIRSELNSTIKKITRPTATVVGDLADLCDQLDDVIDLLDDAEDLSAAVRQSSKKLRSILDDADALRVTLNSYEPTLQETLGTVSGLSVTAAATVRDTVSLIDSAEDLLRRSGSQLDSGTQKTLDSLAAVLRQTANVMATTGGIQNSKDAMTDIIEDLWNDHTGDVDNLLMMDATAEAESLTDSRNGTPQSVQVLIRSQEIKVDEEENDPEAQAAADNGTFWSRVAQMFKDFWAAITGIFH